MTRTLPDSQVKPTRSVASYFSGNFPTAKKYRDRAFQYTLDVVQGEIRTVIFDSRPTAQHQSVKQRQITSLIYQCPSATTASPLA
jgi:cytochrome c oxidase assembly protein Cox11